MSANRGNAHPVKGHKSEYKYVTLYRNGATGKDVWQAKFYWEGSYNSKYYPTERKAAIAVDTFLLNHGKEAINILVPKK